MQALNAFQRGRPHGSSCLNRCLVYALMRAATIAEVTAGANILVNACTDDSRGWLVTV